MSVFMAEETTVRENLPADMWRVCGQIHSAVGFFCFIFLT